MTTRHLTVKHWNEFQHYKDRNPPWIKLHRAVLDDYRFLALPDASKGHLMLLWLFASQNGGMVPYDIPFLERRLFIIGLNLDRLIADGFLLDAQDASTSRAGG